jgi:hypothetical protein
MRLIKIKKSRNNKSATELRKTILPSRGYVLKRFL